MFYCYCLLFFSIKDPRVTYTGWDKNSLWILLDTPTMGTCFSLWGSCCPLRLGFKIESCTGKEGFLNTLSIHYEVRVSHDISFKCSVLTEVRGLMRMPLGRSLDPFQLKLDPVQLLACSPPTIPIETWIGERIGPANQRMRTVEQFQSKWRNATATNSVSMESGDFKPMGTCGPKDKEIGSG